MARTGNSRRPVINITRHDQIATELDLTGHSFLYQLLLVAARKIVHQPQVKIGWETLNATGHPHRIPPLNDFPAHCERYDLLIVVRTHCLNTFIVVGINAGCGTLASCMSSFAREAS
ncbi:Uncharacterised protein [Klebsiella pneumoniae]|uniref:Uncharacterized protein n=1 Tax=Klebsiella pneumoniae TaxID=573 RepID=A0AB74QI11_KLEPN|nr:Uncharacterised protein [Klebsiella pneumoniae]